MRRERIFTFLAARQNVEDYEAIKMYNEWALDVRNNIGNDPTVLEGIGALRRDGSGDVIFEPVPTPGTYNEAVPAERIIRVNARHSMIVGDKETNTVEMNDYLHEETHKEKGIMVDICADNCCNCIGCNIFPLL